MNKLTTLIAFLIMVITTPALALTQAYNVEIPPEIYTNYSLMPLTAQGNFTGRLYFAPVNTLYTDAHIYSVDLKDRAMELQSVNYNFPNYSSSRYDRNPFKKIGTKFTERNGNLLISSGKGGYHYTTEYFLALDIESNGIKFSYFPSDKNVTSINHLYSEDTNEVLVFSFIFENGYEKVEIRHYDANTFALNKTSTINTSIQSPSGATDNLNWYVDRSSKNKRVVYQCGFGAEFCYLDPTQESFGVIKHSSMSTHFYQVIGAIDDTIYASGHYGFSRNISEIYKITPNWFSDGRPNDETKVRMLKLKDGSTFSYYRKAEIIHGDNIVIVAFNPRRDSSPKVIFYSLKDEKIIKELTIPENFWKEIPFYDSFNFVKNKSKLKLIWIGKELDSYKKYLRVFNLE